MAATELLAPVTPDEWRSSIDHHIECNYETVVCHPWCSPASICCPATGPLRHTEQPLILGSSWGVIIMWKKPPHKPTRSRWQAAQRRQVHSIDKQLVQPHSAPSHLLNRWMSPARAVGCTAGCVLDCITAQQPDCAQKHQFQKTL
jgi:hypothetical protein